MKNFKTVLGKKLNKNLVDSCHVFDVKCFCCCNYMLALTMGKL